MPADQKVILTLDLMDIEAPLEPGFDWIQLVDSALWVILLLVLLVALLTLGQRFYQPSALSWQLRRLASKVENTEGRDDVIELDQAWLLYDWCLRLQKLQQKSSPAVEGLTERTALANSELDSLLVKVNQLSFSKQPVSRETYISLLHEAELALKASSGWFSFKGRLVTLWKSLVAGNS
ncbi:MAG: hypothetical protein PF440_08130 [Thiomicrorhabdus sp.]|jgi:hypothetical protein|nr:hypothetical protein [Thiomicrorhabdus sp.]